MKNINLLKSTSILLLFCITFSIFSLYATAIQSTSDAAPVENSEETVVDNGLTETSSTLQSTFKDRTISSCEYIYNLDGSPDYIYATLQGGGYAILSRTTLELLEYSPQGSAPYQGVSAQGYYAGPGNYLEKTATGYKDIVSKQEFALSESEALELAQRTRAQLESHTTYRSSISASENDLSSVLNNAINSESGKTQSGATRDGAPAYGSENPIQTTTTSGTFIPNYLYFIVNPTHGDNSGLPVGNNNTGVCGPVAVQILLGYNNYYNDRRIIPDRYLNGYNDATNTVTEPEKNPNHCTDSMYMTSDTIGTRSEPTGSNSFFYKVVDEIMFKNQSNSWFWQIRLGMKSLLNERISTSDYQLTYQTSIGTNAISSTPIKEEINEGRPVIISIAGTSDTDGHFVVGYGYQNHTYANGVGTYSGYVVHYGWSGDNCIWINSSWCNGYIALKMNHVHAYERVGTVELTGLVEYKCRDCGHRTDAGITMSATESYREIRYELSQNNYNYKYFYLTFATAGNKIFQTFGSKDTIMTLYDANLSELATDDDDGHNVNSMINYNVSANTVYYLKLECWGSGAGYSKLSITSTQSTATNYENISSMTGQDVSTVNYSSLNNAEIICFIPTVSGYYCLRVHSFDCGTYMYFIDPTTLAYCIEDGDSGGSDCGQITTYLNANVRYYIVAATDNISSQTAEMYLIFRPV